MMALGLLLFFATVGVALAIAYLANENVRKFREEEHESFLGRKP